MPASGRRRGGRWSATDGRSSARPATARAALRAAHALEPDVVLLDVGLPDMSGLEVARRLRDGSPRSAVVVVSTQDSADYRDLAVANGARGFLPKAELTGDALDALLGASRVRATR